MERSRDSLCLATMLGPYKDFVCCRINNQSAVCNFRAVKLLMRRVRASDDSRGIMGISFPRRISRGWRRIFLLSLCFGDRLPDDHVMRRPCTKRALRVNSRTEHKKPSHNR